MLPELKSEWMKFKRSNAASACFVLKLNADNQTIVLDLSKTCSPEELAEELSDTQPRWIIWSLKIDRDDGRVQYPIIPIFFSPESCADRSRMLYSSQTSNVAQSFELGKVHTVQDLDDMDEESLKKLHLSTVTR